MTATEAGAGRLVDAALRCYPARWRRRHADEAAELAALLIGDGAPAASIAWNYLVGAAREWLTPRPGRPLSTAATALLAAACLLGFSAALVGQSTPARAAGVPRGPSGPVSATIKPVSPTAGAGSPRQVPPCRAVAPGHVTATGRSQPSFHGATDALSC
ncbi:MAG TPA: hypothetical protein VIZ43_14925 [Trebonia sp.]